MTDEDRFENFTWDGDTWWAADSLCKVCGGKRWTNGRVIKCDECEDWERVDT